MGTTSIFSPITPDKGIALADMRVAIWMRMAEDGLLSRRQQPTVGMPGWLISCPRMVLYVTTGGVAGPCFDKNRRRNVDTRQARAVD